MALLIAGFFDAPEASRGSLHTAVFTLIVSAWQAGQHPRGKTAAPGVASGDPAATTTTSAWHVRRDIPDYAKWFDPGFFSARLADSGYELRHSAGER
jgi:hypothetical protein